MLIPIKDFQLQHASMFYINICTFMSLRYRNYIVFSAKKIDYYMANNYINARLKLLQNNFFILTILL